MNRQLFFITFISLLISCSFNQESVINDNATSIPDSQSGLISYDEFAKGWRPIFNKVNFNGWKGFLKNGTPDGWFVIDSMLVTKGDSQVHPVDLISIQQYEDFELSLEWAISWQANSGIFFHSLENSWAPWAMGPEYSIVDQSNLEPMDSVFRTGANYDMYAPSIDCVEPQGAFNSSRIKVKDAKVEHWLNGQKVVEYELWTDEWYQVLAQSKWKDYPQYGRPIKGSIGIQNHGFETKFRNIKIRDITDVGAPFLSAIKNNEWQIKGSSENKQNDESIILNGENPEIIGEFSNKSLNKDFILRFQLLTETNGAFLICFSSTNRLPDLSNTIQLKNSTIFINEKSYYILLISSEQNPIHPAQWNECVIRRKGDQVLMWLNNSMIIESNNNIIPEKLKYFSIKAFAGDECKLSIQNMFFRKLN